MRKLWTINVKEVNIQVRKSRDVYKAQKNYVYGTLNSSNIFKSFNA